MSDRVITAHLSPELAREVDRLADRLDRPKGWVVKEALARFVELERKRHDLTLEALKDVDEGRLVEHAEIEAWATQVSRSTRKGRRR